LPEKFEPAHAGCSEIKVFLTVNPGRIMTLPLETRRAVTQTFLSAGLLDIRVPRFGRLESRRNPALRDWKACAIVVHF
jgi:hypothetical protein